MDSINKNQAEDNYQDLGAEAAIDKIKQIVNKHKTCFFCTSISSGSHTRPMSVQQVDNEGNLWFLSAEDSHKNLEVAEDSTVKLYFQGSEHSEFLQLDGVATISRDKEKIKELWEFVIRTWFTEGIDDPRITVIKVDPTAGYYWNTKHNSAIAGIKMFFGALTKTTLDDSIEGKLQV
ncbi:MAG: pyridoxamine 5'-phosphate oxidase family protein [Methylotenera sp.]|nr:pyridoxamine 5'-phosphate oxidase family protein [Methylotenera sp.]